MKPRLIAFDFDGTIADTLGEVHRIFNELAPEFGLQEIHADDVPKLRQLTVNGLLRELGVSKRQAPALLTKGLSILRTRIENIELIEGMKEAITTLRPRVDHLGILTSNTAENVELFLKHHGLEEPFDFISSKSKLSGKAKHLKSILRTFSLEKEDMLYVGDELRDVKACKKAGIPIAAVIWGFNAKEALAKSEPEFLVSQPQQLVELLS
ncbi:MAG: HAD-IA family hydrolase [Akkermansiaceae bacterium]|nr:HAD-IA family hydrolase [Akkermansiaceae bacterium]